MRRGMAVNALAHCKSTWLASVCAEACEACCASAVRPKAAVAIMSPINASDARRRRRLVVYASVRSPNPVPKGDNPVESIPVRTAILKKPTPLSGGMFGERGRSESARWGDRRSVLGGLGGVVLSDVADQSTNGVNDPFIAFTK